VLANPILGVLYHSVGGFASGSFYIPYRKVKNWAWEVYWLAGGVFSWIIAPAFFAWAVARVNGVDLLPILREGLQQHPRAMMWAYIFGAMWGVGGLTFGLTMRYLGMSLGMAVALGFCAFFGTLIPPLLGMVESFGWLNAVKEYLPPIYEQNFLDLLKSPSGLVTLGGLAICIVGIVLCGKAGMSKERELPEEDKKATIAEFSFAKGMWVAVFSGIMSACMAFAIKSGDPMGAIAAAHGVSPVFKNTPVLIVVLLGGFTTNFVWCMILSAMNGSFGHYFSGRGASIVSNYFFSAVAGTTWYLQFFFYSMGTTQMGKYDFASWTLHMATIIIFSNMWGLILHEWKGTSRRTHNLILLGIVILVSSTIVVGGGSYLKNLEVSAATTSLPSAH
jgi:L-rhamnose-H+ transport protein